MSRLVVSLAVLLGLLSMNALSAQTCEPDGDVKFVCGTTNPEDLYRVPDAPWVIASGRYSDTEGPLYAVNIRDHGVQEIFPRRRLATAARPRHLSRLPGPEQRVSTTWTDPAGRQRRRAYALRGGSWRA